MLLNVARTLERSAANGPGERFVLWVQGCPIGCPGCWNPDTWSFAPRTLRDTRDLADEILVTRGIEGVTFSGGEPFSQASALADLARRVRSAGLSVFVFTGYELRELRSPAHQLLLGLSDVVVSGRYVERERRASLGWRGSANQQVHFLTKRYGPNDRRRSPEFEIHLDSAGNGVVTGFPVALIADELPPHGMVDRS